MHVRKAMGVGAWVGIAVIAAPVALAGPADSMGRDEARAVTSAVPASVSVTPTALAAYRLDGPMPPPPPQPTPAPGVTVYGDRTSSAPPPVTFAQPQYPYGGGWSPTGLAQDTRLGPYQQPEWTTDWGACGPCCLIRSVESWYRGRFRKNGEGDRHLFQEEIGIGLPHRFMLDFYLNFEDTPDRDLHFKETQVELRYAFADWDCLPLNPTLYLEYRLHDAVDEPDAVEAKPLLSDDPGLPLAVRREPHLRARAWGKRRSRRDRGLSYTVVDQRFSVGVEAQYERRDREHEPTTSRRLYRGPASSSGSTTDPPRHRAAVRPDELSNIMCSSSFDRHRPRPRRGRLAHPVAARSTDESAAPRRRGRPAVRPRGSDCSRGAGAAGTSRRLPAATAAGWAGEGGAGRRLGPELRTLPRSSRSRCRTAPPRRPSLLDERLEPLHRERSLAWWEANLAAGPETTKRYQAACEALEAACGDAEGFARLERSLSEGVDDPVLARSLRVLRNDLLPFQGPRAERLKIVALQAQVGERYATVRGRVRGRDLPDNEIAKLLKESDDVALREEAWRASKEVGAAVAADVRELARLRNAVARALGFTDHYALELSRQDITPEWLDGFLMRMDLGTERAFGAYKADLDARLGKRFKVAPDALRPWHL
jgi:hypothetical protein